MNFKIIICGNSQCELHYSVEITGNENENNTGKYETPSQETKPAVVNVAKKSKPEVPANSGVIKAAGKIYHTIFNAKKEADFHEAIALDAIFTQTFGFSAIKAANITIGKDETLRRYRGLKDKHGNVITHEYFWKHDIFPEPEPTLEDRIIMPDIPSW